MIQKKTVPSSKPEKPSRKILSSSRHSIEKLEDQVRAHFKEMYLTKNQDGSYQQYGPQLRNFIKGYDCPEIMRQLHKQYRTHPSQLDSNLRSIMKALDKKNYINKFYFNYEINQIREYLNKYKNIIDRFIQNTYICPKTFTHFLQGGDSPIIIQIFMEEYPYFFKAQQFPYQQYAFSSKTVEKSLKRKRESDKKNRKSARIPLSENISRPKYKESIIISQAHADSSDFPLQNPQPPLADFPIFIKNNETPQSSFGQPEDESLSTFLTPQQAQALLEEFSFFIDNDETIQFSFEQLENENSPLFSVDDYFNWDAFL